MQIDRTMQTNPKFILYLTKDSDRQTSIFLSKTGPHLPFLLNYFLLLINTKSK